jgi:hypothetical protein
MPVNHKLTNVVKDRVVQHFQLTASELLVSFVGGSTIMVKIEEFNSPPLREGTRIRKISEDQVKLVIECEDGVTFDVRLVDPGSSVAVRDKRTVRAEMMTTAASPRSAQRPSHPAAERQKTFAAAVRSPHSKQRIITK